MLGPTPKALTRAGATDRASRFRFQVPYLITELKVAAGKGTQRVLGRCFGIVQTGEAEDRRIRRVDRLRRASRLPVGKTWDTFEHDRAPVKLRQQLVSLAEGDFVERGVNVLAFGMPGTGKTHAMCAIGHRLVQSGRSVLFIPAYRLVQDMLAARRDLDLPRMLRKLDTFDLLIIDDLGYMPQGAGESELLFTLITERYERRFLGITSNLVFSEWEKVFANPMATAAAIDRIVHHSVILEFDLPSYRTSAAQNRQAENESDRQK